MELEGVGSIEKVSLVSLLIGAVIWLGKKLWSMIDSRHQQQLELIERLQEKNEELERTLIDAYTKFLKQMSDGKEGKD
ncbi:MAG: hypothetical protein NXI20_17885 [bacterium]|nr:hypothetical protein [bacterium]